MPAKLNVFSSKPIRIVVTAGPTRAFIDPVRYISNLSTGKMGYEAAKAAARRKCSVTLISGPTALKVPSGVRLISVETADELEKVVMREVKSADILIMTAAVNDFVPVHIAKEKIRRKRKTMTLRLRRTRDIVARVAERSHKPIVVGFSLETERLADRTRGKLERKNLDLIVGNEYTKKQNPFGDNKPSVLIMDRRGTVCRLTRKSKRVIAERVLSEALMLLKMRHCEAR